MNSSKVLSDMMKELGKAEFPDDDMSNSTARLLAKGLIAMMGVCASFMVQEEDKNPTVPLRAAFKEEGEQEANKRFAAERLAELKELEGQRS